MSMLNELKTLEASLNKMDTTQLPPGGCIIEVPSLESIGTELEEVVTSFADQLEGITTEIADVLSNIELPDADSFSFDSLADGISMTAQDIADSVTGFIEDAVEDVTDMVESAVAQVEGIVKVLESTVENISKETLQAIEDVAKSLDNLKDLIPDNIELPDLSELANMSLICVTDSKKIEEIKKKVSESKIALQTPAVINPINLKTAEGLKSDQSPVKSTKDINGNTLVVSKTMNIAEKVSITNLITSPIDNVMDKITDTTIKKIQVAGEALNKIKTDPQFNDIEIKTIKGVQEDDDESEVAEKFTFEVYTKDDVNMVPNEKRTQDVALYVANMNPNVEEVEVKYIEKASGDVKPEFSIKPSVEKVEKPTVQTVKGDVVVANTVTTSEGTEVSASKYSPDVASRIEELENRLQEIADTQKRNKANIYTLKNQYMPLAIEKGEDDILAEIKLDIKKLEDENRALVSEYMNVRTELDELQSGGY